MPMKNPPHPGPGLKDDLDALEMAIRLEQVIGSSADHWLRLQSAYDLAQVRLNKPIHLSRIDTKVA